MPEKVAVCLFGHLRTYKRCAPFLRKNLLKRHDCDLFMHTWTALDHKTITWHKHVPVEGVTERENIIAAYGDLKGLVIEEQNPVDLGVITIKPPGRKQMQKSLFGLEAMFHSMRESNRLREQYAKENNIQYDWVLCTRPDIVLKTPLDMDFTKTLSETELSHAFFTVTNTIPECHRGFISLSGNDLLFFAQPKVMSDVLENTREIARQFEQNVLDYSPEHIMLKLLKERGLIPYCLNYQAVRDWDIVRFRSRCRFMQIRIRKNCLRIYLFSECLHAIFRFRLAVFGWEFDLCIGASGNKIGDKRC